MQRRDHRHAPELDAIEGPVPQARMRDALGQVARGQFVEVETGAEMLALPVQHHHADVLRQAVEEGLDPEHGRIVNGVALVGAREPQQRNRAAPLRCERGRQIDGQAAARSLLHGSILPPGRFRWHGRNGRSSAVLAVVPPGCRLAPRRGVI
jgi:hypothetical protein